MRLTMLLMIAASACGESGGPSGNAGFVHDGVAVCPGATLTIRSPSDPNRIDVTASCGDTYLAGTFFAMATGDPLDCVDLRLDASACYLGGWDLSGEATVTGDGDGATAEGACVCNYQVVTPGQPSESHALELSFEGSVEWF
jgi:hypothetical protein